MTDLGVFGELDAPSEIDMKPIRFSLTRYKVKDDGKLGSPQRTTFLAAAARPYGALRDFLDFLAGTGGRFGATQALPFVTASLVDDAVRNDDGEVTKAGEREKFEDFMSDLTYYVDIVGVNNAANALMEAYLGRPTRQDSDSQSGPAATGTSSARRGGAKAGARSTGSRQT